MASYLLIETRGPLDGGAYAFELGAQLRELLHDVTIYLLQDAVFTARRNFWAADQLRREADQAGLRLLADAVSCRQRGLSGDRLAPGVEVSDMTELVDLLMERADKAIWH